MPGIQKGGFSPPSEVSTDQATDQKLKMYGQRRNPIEIRII